ncbi:MAG: TolC family protein [Candidatus Hydrogenedentes bacterium]|nr:TolC family protein [Candidatus Hydrogenedentota bacterium]
MSRMSVENVEIAHRKVTLIEQIVLPQSTSAYRIALDGYTAGDMSFLDLLDAERNLIMARLELEESRRDQDQTVLRLAGVRGSLGGATK